VLAPGFGFQGAAFSELRDRYREASPSVIASTSRDILSAGPEGIDSALTRGAEELAGCLA
jgi:orotidine-5'-phosphate decarboxylase